MFRITPDNGAEPLYTSVPSDNTATNPTTRSNAPIPMAEPSTEPVGDGFVRSSADADENAPASQTTENPPVAQAPDEPPASQAVDDTPKVDPELESRAQEMLNSDGATFQSINQFLNENESKISPELKAKLAAKAAQIVIATENLLPDDPDAIDILNTLEDYKSEYSGVISDDIITDKLLEKLYRKLDLRPKREKPVKLPIKRTNNDTPYRFQPRLYPDLDLSLKGSTNYEVTSAVSVGGVIKKEDRRDDAFYEAGAGVTASATYGYMGPQFDLGGYGMFGYKKVLNNDNGQAAGVTVKAEGVYTNGVAVDDRIPFDAPTENPVKHSENPFQGYDLSAQITPYYSFDRLPFDNKVALKISAPIGVNYEKRDGQDGEVGWNVALMTSMTEKRSGFTVDAWVGLQKHTYVGSMDNNLLPNGGVGIHWNLPTSVETNIDRARTRRRRGNR